MDDVVIEPPRPESGFWNGRRVFLTGHTGFKGAWAALWLSQMGAEVHGYALPAATQPGLWPQLGGGLIAAETLADLADGEALRGAVIRARPQIVIHMAAQALVRRSVAEPVMTIAVNTLGTAQVLDALRGSEGLEAVLIITTDKVYAPGLRREFIEDDTLGGLDPYSASKAAAELIVKSFAATYFEPAGVPVATARAGNAIGGGDWADDRLIPNIWRAAQRGEPALLRAPESVRPWQHVLDPLAGYFLFAEHLAKGRPGPRSLNFGPSGREPVSVGELASLIGKGLGMPEPWRQDAREHAKETAYLSLDPGLALETLGWRQRLGLPRAAQWTADWYAAHAAGESARALCLAQIRQFERLSWRAMAGA